MNRFLRRGYPIKIKVSRVALIGALIGVYVFVVTPGWVYLSHQSVMAVVYGLIK